VKKYQKTAGRRGVIFLIHTVKERLVICNEEDKGGRNRVTADEEWVSHVD